MFVFGNDSLMAQESNSTDNTSNIAYFNRCFVPDHFTNHAALRYYCLGSRVCVNSLLSLWSVVAGIINIAAFCKMGLKEGVTQNFLILSVADGLQGLLKMVMNVCFLLDLFEFRFKAVSFNTLMMYLALLSNFPVSVSIITTTVIAVVRCCCVTMPFTVQKTLNTSRQLVAVLVLCGANTVALLYFSAQAISDLKKLPPNFTMWAPQVNNKSVLIFDVVRVSVFFICYVITLISMLILIGALKKSSRFQNDTSSAAQLPPSEGRNARDAQIIKGICQVLAVFTICNFLQVFASTKRLVVTQANEYSLNMYFIQSFNEMLTQISSCVNIFVYYHNNSRFKGVVNRFLCRHG